MSAMDMPLKILYLFGQLPGGVGLMPLREPQLQQPPRQQPVQALH